MAAGQGERRARGTGAGSAHESVPGHGAVAKGPGGAAARGWRVLPGLTKLLGVGGLRDAGRSRRPSPADVSPPPAGPAQVDAAYGDNGLDSGRCPARATPLVGGSGCPGTSLTSLRPVTPRVGR